MFNSEGLLRCGSSDRAGLSGRPRSGWPQLLRVEISDQLSRLSSYRLRSESIFILQACSAG